MDDIDIDDRSFKKPGAVPFKWEIRPGVPKVQQQEQSSSPFYHLTRSLAQQQQQSSHQHHHHRTTSAPNTPVKLSPPPAGFSFQPPTTSGLRSSSSRSTPRTRTVDRCRFGPSILAQPEIVASGCFPTPLLRRKDDKIKSQRRIHRPKPEFHAQSDYTSDLETLSRWSASTRKSLSPFRNSPSSSSFSSSYQSSPRPVTLSDAEWAGFGLF